ncbi:MAG TPA: S9 family peptidase [Vicinamibacterales bacterium]|jgi:dipeptidyl aminopeptidase/acylaminoacyl peptidase
MKKALFLGALLMVGATLAADGPLTPEQTLDRRAIGDLEFSPDGARLTFTVAEPIKGTSRARALWMLDVKSGVARPLTFSGKNDASPRWAPDGSEIAFTSDREEPTGLYLLPLRGGEAERITGKDERVDAFRWSPDGTRIAILMREAKSADLKARERDKDDGRAVDHDDRQPRIWIVERASKHVRQLTAGPWRLRQIEWLPDGKHLVGVATDHPASNQWTDRVYRIDADGGGFTEIAAPRGPIGAIVPSPDGSALAYVGARVDGPEPHDLYVQSLGGGKAVNLSESLDRPVNGPRWIDAQTLMVNVQRGFRTALATVSRSGRTEWLDGGSVNPGAFARSSTGTVAFVGESTASAPELYLQSPGAPPRAVTTLNAQWSSIPVARPEVVEYKGFDGVSIEAALLKPAGAGPFPFVVLVHGGPTGRWSDAFEPWGQLLAARGYAVLYPNVRGSTGYGQKFVEMNRADWGGGDYKDVMAGVDAMIARGVADAARLGIGGWSYGGYMAAWAVTQTTRFKAAVSGAPVIDMASEFGTEDNSAYDEWFYGTPYERLDGFTKSSPMTFVKNVRTPTLLLQGEADLTDPIGQSQQFYRGLKHYNVESSLVLYPREPHGLREEKHLLDRLNRVVAWFDKYLKTPAPGTGGR